MIEASGRRDIHQVAGLIGLEESAIRFLETRFRDVFEASGIDLQQRLFSERRVSLLQSIQAIMHERSGSLDDVRTELSRRSSRSLAHVVGITSGKGGVGKTTTALNLAISCQKAGLRTLLFDADLGLANLHVYAGVRPAGTILQVAAGEKTLAELVTQGPCGVQLICGDSGESRMANLERNLVDCLEREFKELSKTFDVVIIDTAAGISSQVLRFLTLADEILVVTTPNIAATLDAYGMLKACSRSQLRGRIHLLTNQVKSEQEGRELFEKLRQCSERFLGTSPAWAGWVQLSKSLDQANQNRLPLVEHRPRTRNARQFAGLVSQLVPEEKRMQKTNPTKHRSFAVTAA